MARRPARHEIDHHTDAQALGNVADDRLRGVIKKIIADRAFGFIKVPSGQEYFFHASGVLDLRFGELQEGQAVIFRPTAAPKGPRAEAIEPVE